LPINVVTALQKALRHLLFELLYHSPFTMLGVLVGVGLTVALTAAFTNGGLEAFADEFFHITHPLHMLLSAITTAAVYYKHSKRFIATLPVGIIGSIAPCSLSDIIIPYIGGLILGVKELELHICLLVHPHLVLIPAALGTLIGILLVRVMLHPSLIPHSAHVLISSAASSLYFIAFGPTSIIQYLLGLILIVFLAVLLPCCFSDIAFPIFFLPGEVHEHELIIQFKGLYEYNKHKKRYQP